MVGTGRVKYNVLAQSHRCSWSDLHANYVVGFQLDASSIINMIDVLFTVQSMSARRNNTCYAPSRPSRSPPSPPLHISTCSNRDHQRMPRSPHKTCLRTRVLHHRASGGLSQARAREIGLFDSRLECLSSWETRRLTSPGTLLRRDG